VTRARRYSNWWTVSRNDGEREFRLRPERPLRVPDETRAWSNAFKRIVHFARITSRRKSSRQMATAKAYNQRCAVRVTYTPNKVFGQWAAHGRYISRESAAGENSQERGFGSAGPDIDIPKTLGTWQANGDPRLFKLIISPEFGGRLDLEAHTRNLIGRMGRDLGTKLEWAAIIHRNTEHPHVHVALRGIDENGAALRLPREYIQSGIRRHAEELATQQLGYRTQLDAEEAQRREVHQPRFTSLDRAIKNAGQPSPDGAILTVTGNLRSPCAKKRLIVLAEMGLAEHVTADRWRVRANFEPILGEMQRTADRQKALAAHRALMSDPNLPFQVTDIRKIERLRGRALGHGEEESTGRTYMLLEGKDRKVHFIYHSSAMLQARRSGRLASDSNVIVTRRGVQPESSQNKDRSAELRSEKNSAPRSR
jgi:type IV secretory pathway VirD2 relaxase